MAEEHVREAAQQAVARRRDGEPRRRSRSSSIAVQRAAAEGEA